MKPLRILYVVTSFPSITETFIATQVAAMMDLGYDCTIFAYNKCSDTIRHQLIIDYQLEQKTVYHFKNASTRWGVSMGMCRFFWKYKKQLRYGTILSLVNPFTLRQKATYRKAYWDLPIFLLSKKYDVIHCHFGFNGLKVARLKKLGILSQEKCVVSFHGSDLTPSKISEYQILYGDLFDQFAAFTINTPYLKDILSKVHTHLNNVHVLPVGFNEAYLRPYIDLPKFEVFTIVYCGRLMPLKGPQVALKILSQLIKKGLNEVQLLMIGDGVEEQNLYRQVQQLEIANHVQWLGAISQEKVFQQLGQAHVFLYPGITEQVSKRAETQGLVLQEAQYLKVPVVASAVGGVGYGFQPNATGFLIPEGEVDTFVEKVLFLQQNPRIRQAMGETGHDFVTKFYNSTILAIQLEAIYFKL